MGDTKRRWNRGVQNQVSPARHFTQTLEFGLWSFVVGSVPDLHSDRFSG